MWQGLATRSSEARRVGLEAGWEMRPPEGPQLEQNKGSLSQIRRK